MMKITELYNQYKIEETKELSINKKYKIAFDLGKSNELETMAIHKEWFEQHKIKQQIAMKILEILNKRIFKLPDGTFIVPEFDDDNMSTEEIVIKQEYLEN